MKRAAVLLALLFAGCSDSGREAPTGPLGAEALLAKPVQQGQWTPLSFAVDNPCTGEPIAVSGNAHVTTRVWAEGDLVRVRVHTNFNLAGVGFFSGHRYRLQQITNSIVESDASLGVTQTDQVFHLSMNSSGPLPNSLVTMNGTIVIDPAGNSTITPKKWTVTCK